MNDDDPLRDLLGRAGQRVAAMACRHPVADQRQQIMRERLRMGELETNEIVDRVPVGLCLAGMFEIVLGLLLGRATDNVREGEHVD